MILPIFTYKSKYNYSKLNYRLIVGDLPMNKRYGTITVWLFESGEHGKDEMCGSWHKDPYSCSNKLSEAEETKNGGYFIEVIGRDKDDIYDESYHNPSSRGKDKYCSPECVVQWKLQAFIDDMADLESKRLEEE